VGRLRAFSGRFGGGYRSGWERTLRSHGLLLEVQHTPELRPFLFGSLQPCLKPRLIAAERLHLPLQLQQHRLDGCRHACIGVYTVV
jgi:hypothetical protein